MSIQLELQFNAPAIIRRIPPFVWEFHGQYFKGSSFWDLDLIEYKISPDGKIRIAGLVNDRGKNNYAHPWNLHWQYRVIRGGERELITA